MSQKNGEQLMLTVLLCVCVRFSVCAVGNKGNGRDQNIPDVRKVIPLCDVRKRGHNSTHLFLFCVVAFLQEINF